MRTAMVQCSTGLSSITCACLRTAMVQCMHWTVINHRRPSATRQVHPDTRRAALSLFFSTSRHSKTSPCPLSVATQVREPSTYLHCHDPNQWLLAVMRRQQSLHRPSPQLLQCEAIGSEACRSSWPSPLMHIHMHSSVRCSSRPPDAQRPPHPLCPS